MPFVSLRQLYPGTANYCLNVLRAVYHCADRMEIFPDPIRNPARRIRANELPGPPNRELSLQQIGQLGTALNEAREEGVQHRGQWVPEAVPYLAC